MSHEWVYEGSCLEADRMKNFENLGERNFGDLRMKRKRCVFVLGIFGIVKS